MSRQLTFCNVRGFFRKFWFAFSVVYCLLFFSSPFLPFVNGFALFCFPPLFLNQRTDMDNFHLFYCCSFPLLSSFDRFFLIFFASVSAKLITSLCYLELVSGLKNHVFNEFNELIIVCLLSSGNVLSSLLSFAEFNLASFYPPIVEACECSDEFPLHVLS